jgi:SpoVK/Ycf46/Vps4 family AAA+-type ATPase
MQLWDDIFRDPSNQVMVIGASNRPQDLDAAIQRRFERSYLVGMPDERARIGIFRKLLHPVKVEDGFSYKRCSIMTAKYTPSDIVSICKAAACIPMREQQRAKREAMEAYEAEMKQMHLESGNNSMNSSRSEGKGGKIKVPLRSLTLKDIQEALQTVIPSTVVASRYVKGYNDPRGQSGNNEGTGMPPQGTSNGVINPFTGKFQYMHDDEDDGYDDYDDDDDDDDDEEEE